MIISNPGNFIVSFINGNISKTLYDMISGNNPKNNNDINIITKQIIFFIYSLIAVYVSGNWYYLMFYDDGTGIPNSHKFDKLLDTITETGGIIFRYFRLGSQLEPVWLMNLFLCKILKHIIVSGYGWIESLLSTMFVSILPSELYHDLSQTVNIVIKNHQFLFIIFTIQMIQWIVKYSDSVYSNFKTYNLYSGAVNSYNKYANQGIDTNKGPKLSINKTKLPKNKFHNFLVMTIILNIFIGVKGLTYGLMSSIGIKPPILETIEGGIKFMKELPSWLILGPFVLVILFIIAIIVNIVVVIRISGFLCIVYLYIYSYLGANFRGGSNALSTFYNNIGKPNVCKESNSFSDKISKIISFVYQNLSLFIVAICTIISIQVYMKLIKNQSAATSLVSMNIIIVVIIMIIISYNTFKTKTDLQDYNYIEPYNL